MGSLQSTIGSCSVIDKCENGYFQNIKRNISGVSQKMKMFCFLKKMVKRNIFDFEFV